MSTWPCLDLLPCVQMQPPFEMRLLSQELFNHEERVHITTLALQVAVGKEHQRP